VLRVLRVLAPNPDVYTLEGTNTWVVGEEPSIVIDPGPNLPEHLSEVARVAGRVGAVLVTHDHPDHAPGAVPFAAMTGAPPYAFRLDGARHLRDGQTIRAGDVEAIAIHTPGHTSDHLSFHLPASAAVFTGDMVLGRGTSFIDPPGGELALYLRSLKRLQELGPRTLYPGHGPVVLRAAEKLQEYLDHRAEREEQVVAALNEGPRRIAQLVGEIYAAYPTEVHGLAARSLLAHLLKLQGEARVTREGSGEDASWSLVKPQSCARCGKDVRGRARYCGSCSLILLQEGADAHRSSDPGGQTV
jgi:glyoxylase-like metal-dependent hydrolase (beta-lactamase superfamily II)